MTRLRRSRRARQMDGQKSENDTEETSEVDRKGSLQTTRRQPKSRDKNQNSREVYTVGVTRLERSRRATRMDGHKWQNDAQETSEIVCEGSLQSTSDQFKSRNKNQTSKGNGEHLTTFLSQDEEQSRVTTKRIIFRGAREVVERGGDMDEGHSRLLHADRNHNADSGLHRRIYCARRKPQRERNSRPLDKKVVQSLHDVRRAGNVLRNVFHPDVLVHPDVALPRSRLPRLIAEEVASGTPRTLRSSFWHHVGFHISLPFDVQLENGMASRSPWMFWLCSTYVAVSPSPFCSNS